MSKEATAPDFSSILDDQPTEVYAPPVLPVGTYLCTVGPARYDKSSKKGTPFVEHILRPIAAEDDVDADDLAEVGGLDGSQIFATFYYKEGDTKSLRRLDQFHEACGIDLAEPASRRARSDAIVNAQVLVYIRHEDAGDESGRVRARPAKFIPVTD